MDLHALGKDPVCPERPAGDEVRYHPLFEQLQTELDRNSLPSVAGSVDWEKVVSLCSEILSTKCKDLLVAGYLTVALIHTRKVEGLATGMQIFRDLLEHHGPNLFPLRQRARILSIEWLKERSEAALQELKGCDIEAAELARMRQDFAKVQQRLGELVPGAPTLHALDDFLKNGTAVPSQDRSEAADDSAVGARSAEEMEPIEPAAPEMRPSAPTASAPRPEQQEIPAPGAGWPELPKRHYPEPAAQSSESKHLPAAPAPPTPRPANQHEAVDAVVQHLRHAAAFLREIDSRNPMAYRLSRQAAWLEICDLPPLHSGSTLVPPPPDALVKRLAILQQDRDAAPLIQEVEAALQDHIFWLDLNRFDASALSEIGAVSAAAAVRQETSSLLQRLPGLEELSFADGSLFADAATRQWLRESGRHHPQDAGPSPADTEPAAVACEAPISAELAAATALLREGKIEEAVERLQNGVRKSLSERERLQWRLALSRALVETENAALALPHLEQVVTDVDRFGLDSYEPPLALEGWRLAWHAYQSQQDDLSKEKAKKALHRIGRIDLAEMVRLTR